MLVSAGRTKRPWLGHKERRAAPEGRPPFDPGCYLCPGNTRASGARNPEYTSTFVFTNDFAALRPDAGDEHLHDGLLRGRGGDRAPAACCASRHATT